MRQTIANSLRFGPGAGRLIASPLFSGSEREREMALLAHQERVWAAEFQDYMARGAVPRSRAERRREAAQLRG
jgi:hypothetical protein